MNDPWEDLPKKARDAILHGSGDEEINFIYDDGARRYETKKEFEGVIPNMERRYGETDSAWVQEDLERFQSEAPCEVCHGYRLKPEALAVKIGGLHIGQVCEQSIRDADAWFRDIDKKLNKQQQEIAVRILKEIRARLKFLNNVGLDYLTLARASGTLSGGESQRIRLASQIGSGLTGVLYVLDEPSIGLHQRDNAKLLESLKGLRDMGNTVLVVEHDEDAIRTRRSCHRHGAGRRRPWRPYHRRRHPGRHHGQQEKPHRQISQRAGEHSHSRRRAARPSITAG